MNFKKHLGNRLIAIALVFSVFLAACGGDSGSTNDAQNGNAGGNDDGGVTIDHIFGSTTIEAVPTRIVTIGSQWSDVIMAMGVQPVGMMGNPMSGGWYEWQDENDEVTIFPYSASGLPFEQIKALNPDLILATYSASDETTYRTLSAIAPTLPLLEADRGVDPWQDMAEVAGKFLKNTVAADKILADYNDYMETIQEEFAGLQGKTFAFVNYVPGDSLWVVADPEDGSSVFFRSLGLSIVPAVLEAADGGIQRTQLSFEQVELLDGDLLLMLPNGGDPNDLPGFQNLTAVKNGAVALVDFSIATALNTPSPASLAYAIDDIREELTAAASN